MASSIIEKDNINKNQEVFDLIIILDESGSMEVMGDEPIKSVNMYIKNFNDDTIPDNKTLTFVTFNTVIKTHIKEVLISDMKEIPEDIYKPNGVTSLNDAICYTINDVLKGSKPDKKILVIITDGEENFSCDYNKNDVKNIIKLVEDKHDWKIVFLGANIDSFYEGQNMNINRQRTCQFYQDKPGDLLELCMTTSIASTTFTRARTEGYKDAELTIPNRAKTDGYKDAELTIHKPSNEDIVYNLKPPIIRYRDNRFYGSSPDTIYGNYLDNYSDIPFIIRS